jgi:hypothetical protein
MKTIRNKKKWTILKSLLLSLKKQKTHKFDLKYKIKSNKKFDKKTKKK